MNYFLYNATIKPLWSIRRTNDGSTMRLGSVCLTCGYWAEIMSSVLAITCAEGIWHRFQPRTRVLVGFLGKLLVCPPHVFPPDGETLFFVIFKNRNRLDECLQNPFDQLRIFPNRRSERGYRVHRIGQADVIVVDQLEKALALGHEARRNRQRGGIDDAPFQSLHHERRLADRHQLYIAIGGESPSPRQHVANQDVVKRAGSARCDQLAL